MGRSSCFAPAISPSTGCSSTRKVARVYPFKVGSTLELDLYDHDGQVTCTCVVARVVEPGTSEGDQYPSGFGVRIVNCGDAERGALRAMIERIKAQGDVY